MRVLPVSQVTSYLRGLIESDELLQDLWVEGEVSNLTRATSGHIYFTLKEGGTQLRAVLFRREAMAQPFLPANGQAIVVHGRLSVYEATGACQVYVDLVQPIGVGALHMQFEEMRRRLEAEGLFDVTRKRALPQYPRVIGIVTSLRAAALRDILNVLSRRYPLAEVIISPTLVQGDEAPTCIVNAIRALQEWDGVDVIIVARGGGSLEELWAFNDERVARAIYASKVPVISGVGHEVDFTIADFVADVRAPTPSAAAELVAPDCQEMSAAISTQLERLTRETIGMLERYRDGVNHQSDRLDQASPKSRIRLERQRVDDLSRLSAFHLHHRLELREERISGYLHRLDALNPAQILARGYSVCRNLATGATVKSIAQTSPDDPIRITVSDGDFQGRVV